MNKITILPATAKMIIAMGLIIMLIVYTVNATIIHLPAYQPGIKSGVELFLPVFHDETISDTETLVSNKDLAADFTADQIITVAGTEILFTDLSTGPPINWEWDFDNDGTIDSYIQNPTWTYNDPGLYTVALTVSDGSGSDTEIKTDYIDVRVNIPDANFKAKINEYLGQGSGYNPTIANLNSITGTLDAGISWIHSIEGAQHLINVTNLRLNYNQISDISAVAGLTNLTYLRLNNNQISDISAVAGLINLTTLELRDNQISDISAIAGLINLTYLKLWDNQISDISTISGLTNLTSLNLTENQIIDISAVAGLINLTTLYLNDNQITDIFPLVENTGFGSGNRLILKTSGTTNPLSQEALNVHIPILQSRGFDVLEYPAIQNIYAACYPVPARNETGVSLNSNLEWRGNFPSKDATYDVWLGETNDSLVNVGSGTTVNDTLYSFNPILYPDTDYWWKVRTMAATDTLWSGLWHFTTEPNLSTQFLADFSYSQNCYDKTVYFTDSSVTNNGIIISWIWDFGDPAITNDTSSLQNPLYVYNSAGSYQVSLTVTNSAGFSHDTVKTVEVFNSLEVDIGVDQTVCPGDSIFISPIVSGGEMPYSYLWSTGDLDTSLWIYPTSDTIISIIVTDNID